MDGPISLINSAAGVERSSVPDPSKSASIHEIPTSPTDKNPGDSTHEIPCA
ncbi:MAG: hypothetical protein IPK82_20550 [Polyangiaceae bacterium]|nr:hypothetical protein [Polyangiaceae bacterium]MBK8251055.1 hypothetical protein [Polyangiaceae bacterium]MBK8255036.1 hypothetical protein [Polyangiaceae bacterium]